MNIAIITGGFGPEREISIRSANFVEKNINFANYKTFLYPDDFETFLQEKDDFDIIIPIIHGEGGEDGELQQKLDAYNIKYIFSSSDVHKKCFDKKIAKDFAVEAGFKTPQNYFFQEIKDSDFPLIAKPRENGSSVGIHFIKDRTELEGLGFLENYIYEKYVEGREFTVGVVETKNGTVILPIMEAKIEKEIFDYKDKYSNAAKNIEIFPENLSEDLEKSLKQKALSVHLEIGLKHLSRTDIIVSEKGDIYFLEINSIPGCTSVSFIPKMVEKTGLDFSKLLKYWCEDTLKNNSL